MKPFFQEKSHSLTILLVTLLFTLSSAGQELLSYSTAFENSQPTLLREIDQRYSLPLANEQTELQQYQRSLSFEPTGNGTNYDVKYHRFNFRINPDTSIGKYIKGFVTTHFETKSANFSLLKFDFASSLTVDSVVYHNVELKAAGRVVEDVDTLKITLPSALAYNTLDSVRIYYKGVPPTQSGGFGYVLSTHGTAPVRNYVYVLAEPYYARDWFPCKLDMYDKIDAIDMYVSVPAGYKAAGNGLLMSTTTVGSNLVYHWKHQYPIAAYLITTAVANYEEYNNGPANINGTNTPMFHYIFPEHNTATAKANMDKTKVFLQTLSSNSLFGDYPFKNEKYGNFEMGYSGMENQTFTGMVYSKFDDVDDWTTNAHETAHQWFGNKVTCGSWAHIWVNEGFARYAELIAAEFSSISLTPNLATRRTAIKTTARGTTTETTYRPDTSSVSTIFSSHVYERGAMILGMLRLRMGDVKFFQGLRSYLNDPALAYKAALTSDLQGHMETAFGSSLNEFFTDWIYGRGVPTYTTGWARVGSRMHLQLTQTRSAGSTVSHFEMPVQVRVRGATLAQDVTVTIYDQNGSLSTIGYTGNSGSQGPNRIFFDLPFTPTSVSVTFDPNDLILSNTGTISMVASLPLDDIQLKASRKNGSIEISWKKETPENVVNYEIERSSDGINFEKMVTIKPKTGSSLVNRYVYEDVSPLPGRSFYRLKAINPNGTSEYSTIVSAVFNDKGDIRIHPNPASQEVNLYIPPELSGKKILVNVFSYSGEKMIQEEMICNSSLIKIDISKLAGGVYNLQLLVNEAVYRKSLVIKNAR